MIEARRLQPTDVLTLVPYSARTFHNEAWTRERIGGADTARPLAVAVDQVRALSRGRCAWVSFQHQRLMGLAGARKRGGEQAWEFDYLVDATPGHEATVDLLERAAADAGSQGVEKLFLRLDASSDLLPAAREAGFLPYQEEWLYATPSPPRVDVAWDLRAIVPADSYPLFRLYSRAVPEAVRRSEAATFGEWHAAREQRWLRNALQLVKEGDGRLQAWVAAVRLPQGVGVELLLDPEAEAEAEQLVGSALQALDARAGPVLVLIPKYEEALAARLERAGFLMQREFVCTLRRTVRPQTLPKAIPAVVKTVVGV